jgi:hypothetical protein
MESKLARWAFALTSLVAAVTPLAAATSKTFVVVSTSGSKDIPGTLTWAVYQANYQGGDINYINFNIPAATGESEIILTETLYLARPTVINGGTQSGYAGQPLIRINCNKVMTGFNIVPAGGGLPGGGGSTIQGLRITNFAGNAINISAGADGNTVANNQIGFQPLATAGTFSKNTIVAPRCDGITIESNGNAVRNNTISGVSNAITISSSNNSLDHNNIGTDPAGAAKIGVDAAGIVLSRSAQQNLIGPANVISGVASDGVEVFDAGSTGNRIFGNKIGLNAAGTAAIPNGNVAVFIANGPTGNWVGGPYGGAYPGNVMSGNANGAVVIGAAGYSASNNNNVEGNLIGTDAGGSNAVGTQINGVTIQNNSTGNIIRKNVIVGEVNHGIVLAGANNNSLYGNWIGVTDRGPTIANGSYGVYLSDASNNIVQLSAANAKAGAEQNVFGSNKSGPVGVYGNSTGNIIEVAAAPSRTFVVTTVDGSRDTPGSLTWAIYQANYQGGQINYINFAIPGATGEIEIKLTEQLYIARPMVINAATQSGDPKYSGAPLIRINCNSFASGFTIVPAGNGLPGGGGSTIQGFRIINYASNAITIFRGADSNLIADNQIGFAPTGNGTYFRNVSVSAECRGIGLESSSNVIRGNTISGVHNGITLAGDVSSSPPVPCQNNTIERNFIGTDPTGTTKIGNDSDGIFLTGTAQNNLIGPGNVLSGMASAGVELLHEASTGNRIFGNMIGVNAAGTAAIPNGELGVLIANGASNNWVGGPYGGAYAGNVISGCGLGGVAIGTSEFPGIDGSNDNHVEGNFIGSDRAETKAVGTQVSGVTVQDKSKRNVIRRNVIVGQTNHGVVLADAASNAMYGNWLGVTSKGTIIPNGGFGAFLADASNNTVQLAAASATAGAEQNVFGVNKGDPVGVYGNSSGNVIDLPSRPLNISTRMRVETGDNALIAGFIITGISPKTVIIRGLGTSLKIGGALADPSLELNTPTGSIVNDDWKSTQQQAITASTIPPTSDLESGIVATLAPGAYTATLRGKGNGTGVGLIEIYELDSSGSSSLANISTRGVVQSGDDVMIAGFIIGGAPGAGRVAVRALGPSLSAAGITNALQDPTLRLIDSNGALVRQSDNWQDDSAQAAQLSKLGLQPPNPVESGLVATLAPGAYTAVVAGTNGKTGIGLVEVYNLP